MINFQCPKCGEELSVPQSVAGQIEACPGCGNICAVPKRALSFYFSAAAVALSLLALVVAAISLMARRVVPQPSLSQTEPIVATSTASAGDKLGQVFEAATKGLGGDPDDLRLLRAGRPIYFDMISYDFKIQWRQRLTDEARDVYALRCLELADTRIFNAYSFDEKSGAWSPPAIRDALSRARSLCEDAYHIAVSHQLKRRAIFQHHFVSMEQLLADKHEAPVETTATRDISTGRITDVSSTAFVKLPEVLMPPVW